MGSKYFRPFAHGISLSVEPQPKMEPFRGQHSHLQSSPKQLRGSPIGNKGSMQAEQQRHHPEIRRLGVHIEARLLATGIM